MLPCDRPEKPKKTYRIPSVSKKRAKAIADGTFKPNEPKPIANRSKKRQQQEREYSEKRKAFLSKNTSCMIRIKCHGSTATEVHHPEGRIGNLLTDETKFIGTCHDCHVWAEMNPIQAKALGVSNDRLTKK